MKTYFVSRNLATQKWAQENALGVDHWLSHISDITQFIPGDVVIGTLPIPLAAALHKIQVSYIHFSIQVPAELRAKELSDEQLLHCSPKLFPCKVLLQ
ncbi:MAG: CRISPR-associated protein Csx16 [Bermanella sp.]|jgi:CRISPR-associated protein Csx16